MGRNICWWADSILLCIFSLADAAKTLLCSDSPIITCQFLCHTIRSAISSDSRLLGPYHITEMSSNVPAHWVSVIKLCIIEGKQGADGSSTVRSEITDLRVCSWQAGRCSWAVHYGTWQTGKSWRIPWSSFCGSFWGMWTEAGTFSLRDRQRSLKHHNSCR